ncbi:MAG: transposase [Candidatus Omnitrophica bacterium]|nr:transposase [Candidatus Omnitrophota bacterium]MCF7894319.1 transposase [Candidatus Omnitrophota bacterium]
MPGKRRSIRLKEYDYAQQGAYFVTICVNNRKCLFGDVFNGEMILNERGRIVQQEWHKTGKIRKNIELDEFVIMPNHLHGIINIVGAHCNVPLHDRIEQFGRSTSNSIPTIVKLFKSTTTKQINIIRNTAGIRLWQRNYYEHVIRNEFELNCIREYIATNPANWKQDQYYSE